jgi:hypothetical protein
MAIFYDSNCVRQIWHFDQIKYGSVLVLGCPQLDMMRTIQPCHILVDEVAYLLPVHLFFIMVWTSFAMYRNSLWSPSANSAGVFIISTRIG